MMNNVCTKDGQKRFNGLDYTLLKQEIQPETGEMGLSVNYVSKHVGESQRKGIKRVQMIKENMIRLYGEKGYLKIM